MLGVIISAVAIIMLGYLCVGLAGYLAFPTSVASNVLLSFSQDDWLMQARPHAGRPPLAFLLRLALLRLRTLWVHWFGKGIQEEKRKSHCTRRSLPAGLLQAAFLLGWDSS